MTKTIVTAAAAVLSGLLLLPGQASADDTTVSVVVANGGLTISAQPSSTTLTGATFNAQLPSTARAAFGNVTVSDGRGLATPWAVTASSTDYLGVSNTSTSLTLSESSPLEFGAVANPSVGPTAAAGSCTASGGRLVAANDGVAIASGTSSLTQLEAVTCTFNPNLTMTVPANTPAQTYRGTVTLTAA